MMEFIAWDKEYKRFIPWGYDTREKGCFTAPVNPSFPSFQYISKKDIEDNKIYADSSIVEFSYLLTTDEHYYVRAYFTWDERDLRYILVYHVCI